MHREDLDGGREVDEENKGNSKESEPQLLPDQMPGWKKRLGGEGYVMNYCMHELQAATCGLAEGTVSIDWEREQAQPLL